MYIAISFPNTKTWISDMHRVARRLSLATMDIAGRQVIQDSYETAEKLFATEGGSGYHGHWAELSPNYKIWKEKHGKTNIMVLTGALKESLIKQTKDSIASVYRQGNVWHIKWGTTVTSPTGFDYPLYHQMGGDVKRKVPARRTIDPKREDIHRWMQIIQRQLVDSLEKYEKPFDRVRLERPAWIDRGDYSNVGRR